jgi:hypothetical protein
MGKKTAWPILTTLKNNPKTKNQSVPQPKDGMGQHKKISPHKERKNNIKQLFNEAKEKLTVELSC